MSDLISRQDAIDAICTWDKFGVDERNRVVRWHEGLEPYVHLRDVVSAIEKLPSAEPEITRCHKCVHWLQDTVRQNSNDAGWWNEAVCEKYSDDIWTVWKDADWFCADAERRTYG